MGNRTAILNGFGRQIGDGIIGLQALDVAMTRGLVPDPVLFRLPGLPPMVQAVHRAFGVAVRDLPWSHATPSVPFAAAEGFDVVDIRDFAFDPDFLRLPMFDYFLRALGGDAASVPAEDRRNGWMLRRVRPVPSDGLDGRILVCPRAANPMRAMPDAFHAALLEELLAFGPVATQGAVPAHLARFVVPVPQVATLEELCGIVAGAAWVVSTDTGMVHLADAMERPCLAFFPTHDPVLRVRDYPFCRAVRLESGLPAQEFARDEHDVAAALAAWTKPGWRDGLVGLLRDAWPG
ncbi:glycosyltransferase family 9 protein [Falsiroseomonas sp. HW251]|uniref:glycosyltransferase family 9 protein n=1 Tax=Falsiroseomonas sp. HW251 TaxID=3390998 RepID=UPI003D318E1C